MQKRHLGKSGIEVFPLPFGGNVFGWTIDEATFFKLLDALSIAWLLAQLTIAAPIASATSTEQLNDLVNAVTLTLDKEAWKY